MVGVNKFTQKEEGINEVFKIDDSITIQYRLIN